MGLLFFPTLAEALIGLLFTCSFHTASMTSVCQVSFLEYVTRILKDNFKRAVVKEWQTYYFNSSTFSTWGHRTLKGPLEGTSHTGMGLGGGHSQENRYKKDLSFGGERATEYTDI